MPEQLGILVITDNSLDHLIGLTRAAVLKGKKVSIFFTGRGVLLTQEKRFAELESLAEMSLCQVSFESLGLDRTIPIPGISGKGFASQARHADLIYYSDRYLVL